MSGRNSVTPPRHFRPEVRHSLPELRLGVPAAGPPFLLAAGDGGATTPNAVYIAKSRVLARLRQEAAGLVG